MYALSRLPTTLTLLTLAALRAQAVNVVDMLSFGIGGHVSDDHRTVSGWRISGDGHEPQILSDRIILVPPAGGNKRGSAWAEKPSPYTEWDLSVNFRVAGPERGGGNMQIWYVQNGEQEVKSGSVYTVGKFDGLALVIDQYGGKGGTLRGFLNDGSVSYKDHHSVDQLAFGHCDLTYRNLGRFMHLNIKQTAHDFEVSVDGKECFKTDKVKLPSGNQFGVSAASAETPDSFELNQFKVEASTSPDSGSLPERRDDEPRRDRGGRRESEPDTPADRYKTWEEQFRDLHDRLLALQHRLDGLSRDVESANVHHDDNHQKLVNRYLNPMHDFQESMQKKLQSLESSLEKTTKSFDADGLKRLQDDLKNALKSNHESIMNQIPALGNAPSPRLGFFVFIIIAFQLLLVGSYIIYKKRKNSMPKKYL